jgi:signal transduction histidine kinase
VSGTRVDQQPIPVGALNAFVEVLSDADAGATRDHFYGRLCEVICRLGAMERAVLFRYDEVARRVRAAGAHGIDLAIFERAHVTVESAPIARRALEADEVVDALPPWSEDLPAEFVSLLGEGRLFCVPMAASGRWIGVVLCDRPGRRALSERQRNLLWSLGKSAALAAMARIATFEGERARELQQRIDLAREVHDAVVQRLFGVSLALDAGGEFPPAERRRAAAEIQGALVDLRTAVQRPLRRTSRPTAVSLGEELERLVALHEDLRIVVDPASDLSVPAHLEALAQSVLVESIRNVRKHATPTFVSVRAGRERGAFILEVANDGLAAASGTTGMGLRLAAFEALQARGFIEFGEREPGVWKVRLVVPVDEPA